MRCSHCKVAVQHRVYLMLVDKFWDIENSIWKITDNGATLEPNKQFGMAPCFDVDRPRPLALEREEDLAIDASFPRKRHRPSDGKEDLDRDGVCERADVDTGVEADEPQEV